MQSGMGTKAKIEDIKLLIFYYISNNVHLNQHAFIEIALDIVCNRR